jgi:excisionase family DNA binding protein
VRVAVVAEITRRTPLADLPEFLRIEETATVLDCGKGVVYAMVRTGELASVRLGRLLRIPREALEQMVKK